MEGIKRLEVDSDSDNEDIFFGPITKREMMLKLKHYNLCSDELLEPLQKFQDSDVLDASLILYYEDAFPKGNISDEDKWTLRCTESSINEFRDQTINDTLNNIESLSSTGLLYKDSLDLSDRTSLTESQLLKKYTPSQKLSESSQLLNSTENKSILEYEQPCNELDEIYHDSLNIQSLNLDDKKSMLVNSTAENSASISLNSIQEESKSLSSKSITDKCEIVSLNSTSEKHESISLNSTPQKLESLSSYNSTPEKSDTSYSNSNDHSGFNCTLEEMEMLMKFGENYMNENKDLSINSVGERSKTEYEKENYSPMTQNHSADGRSLFTCKESQIQTQALSTEKIKENNIFLRKYTNTPKQHCYESPSPFKLPTLTISKKSPATGYRNIRSPVAMYIKSTPKVPLVQNVSKKTVHSATFRETHSTRLEAEECIEPGAAAVLPARSYRPAGRAVLLSRQPEPMLPGSLRRLIRGPLLPEVIRHVGRVATVPETCEPCPPVTPTAPAPDQDLTMLSSPPVQGDVSVYVSTNAARTTRLQHT